MSLFFAIILLLLAVIPAQLLFDRFNRIPLAIYQILLGLGLSFLPLFANLTIDPEVFLLVIISTLMFSDSRHLNLGRFADSLRGTLALAINLVVLSILVVGALAHWITPELTWFGGFMLAAILSPTDAVAYQSITARTPLPADVNDQLENESLLNDATGLVAFNLTVSALSTGHFSLVKGLTNFGYVFLGGIVMGLFLGWGFMTIRRWMIMHDSSINIVIVPLILGTPYFIYFVAEELGMSGILAVVAAGLIRTWEQSNWQFTASRIQNSAYAVEDLTSAVLNGVVFIILGINLPTIYRLGINLNMSLLRIAVISLVLYLALVAVRFGWFYTSYAREGRRERVRKSLLAGLNGIHGTVTLMMALSIPQTLPGLSAQLRSALVLITTLVILLSMLLPIIFTSRLVGEAVTPDPGRNDAEIWNQLVDRALRELQKQQLPAEFFNFIYPLVVTQRPMAKLKQRELMRLFHQTQHIERQASGRLITEQQVTPAVVAQHAAAIDREVLNQQLTPWTTLLYWSKVLKHQPATKADVQSDHDRMHQRQRIEAASYTAIMDFLKRQDRDFQSVEANTLARIYSSRHDETLDTGTINQERFYMLQLFAAEIEQVHHLYWQHEITLAKSRQFIYDLSLQQTTFIGHHF